MNARQLYQVTPTPSYEISTEYLNSGGRASGTWIHLGPGTGGTRFLHYRAGDRVYASYA